MLTRFLLGTLVVLSLAFGVLSLTGASDVDCGPVTGTVPVDQNSVPLVSVDDARAAALVAIPGAAVTEADLDDEDGFLVYEIGLAHDRQEIEVVVDAGTGDVLCTDRD